MDYDFITTCNWTQTGTFTLRAYRGTGTDVASSYTIYYRKKGSPTWSSTNNGQVNISSTGEWEVANNWNKSGNDVLTHSYYGITAIDSCTSVYFNESTLGTSIGKCFLLWCWCGCSNLASMPEGFNLPQGVTAAGSEFLFECWGSCSSLVSMPESFNLPQGITGVVGAQFLAYCWVNCTSLTSLPRGFSLPDGITIGNDFLTACWYNCTNLKQDGYVEDLVFNLNANSPFGGTCPVEPNSVSGASKANPVYVPVNRPEPPIGPFIGEKYPLPPFRV